MKLNLLDIDKYVQENDIKPVTSAKYQLAEKKIDTQGLFSEEIFGRIASKERKKQFGYIDLSCTIIHPEAWQLLCSIDTIISKILNNAETYTITEDGELMQSDSGNSGVHFFISIIDKIDFSKFKKQDNVKFLKKNKDKILITKLLVWPAGIRDIQVSKSTDFMKVEYSEINKLYIKLINQTKSLPNDTASLPEDFISMMVNNIQRTCHEIHSWIKSRMKGKHGLLRGGSLKKTTDYSARLVIIPDPKLDVGEVGLPWQVVLKLFEPFTIHYILNKNKALYEDIKEFLKSDIELDSSDLKRFIVNLNDNPDIATTDMKEKLTEAAKEIVDGKIVTYKRDPVENRDSWIAGNVKVDPKGFVMKISPLDCVRNGADFDGDSMAVFALFSKEATEEAKKKMHPKYNKGNWITATNAKSVGYPIELDAAATIYMATKQ